MRALWSSRVTTRVFVAAVSTSVVGLSVFALLDLREAHPARPLLLLLLLAVFTSASTAIVLFEQRTGGSTHEDVNHQHSHDRRGVGGDPSMDSTVRGGQR